MIPLSRRKKDDDDDEMPPEAALSTVRYAISKLKCTLFGYANDSMTGYSSTYFRLLLLSWASAESSV
jgi:hypothetical protein